MKIAIIGAGFCGLAAAWQLLKKGCSVELFDPAGVGGGASGIAGGLLHPYPGENGNLGIGAKEALADAKELLEVAQKELEKPVACWGGILRKTFNLEQSNAFASKEDVECVEDNLFLIRSGVTVYSSLYLEGLWLACKKLGAVLHHTKINTLEELQEYGQIIVACGAGVLSFCKNLDISIVKGQVLVLDAPCPEKSKIGKGYLAKSECADRCILGSTYERNFTSSAPCLESAATHLAAQMSFFFPDSPKPKILECKAAFRVRMRGGYYPICKQLDQKSWLLTGMGSRGLLYHAYFAKLLAKKLLNL